MGRKTFSVKYFSILIIPHKEGISMYTATETKEMRAQIALELARYKVQKRVAEGFQPKLDDDDVNELFVVAGLPLLQPGELDKELEVIA